MIKMFHADAEPGEVTHELSFSFHVAAFRAASKFMRRGWRARAACLGGAGSTMLLFMKFD